MKTLSRIISAGCAAIVSMLTANADKQFADMDEQVDLKPVTPPADPSLANARYLDVSLPIEERINDLLTHLTYEEKAEIIHGASGYTYGKIPRIGLAEYGTLDGPQGVRLAEGKTSTAFPTAIAMAATWNTDLIRQTGNALAEECKAHKGRVLLGPGVNIMRSPLGGRNFEYFGEDPVLSGEMAAAYIDGLQQRRVAACLKHWLLNDQEWARTLVSVDLGERALREIYARPFEIAIRKASPWSIMSSYNRVRGQYSSHNARLNSILYKDLGWDGAMISDWGAWQDDKKSLNGGCTICMPSGKNDKRNKTIVQQVEQGNIDKDKFEDAVRRNLRLSFRVNAFNTDPAGETGAPWQDALALKVAQESIVLLKNENALLPLDEHAIGKVAVLGPNADQYHTMADGSGNPVRGAAGATRGKFEITPLKAIVDRLGKDKVVYSPGFRFEKPRMHSCPDVTTVDNPVDAAKQADVVLYFGGIDHSYDRERQGWGILEGADKPDINLIGNQAETIRKVVEANPKTIVILTTGTPVQVEDWQDKVPGILCSWYGGQSAGTSVASVVFGDVNPSGKTPCTFGKRLTDWLCHQLGTLSYPGELRKTADGKDEQYPVQQYGDYIWVGYRHFDKAGIEPRYPFGYGLSYTTFKIERADSGNEGSFAVKVTNTGKRDGAEVVQCYVSKPGTAAVMPVRELIAFQKVFLKPGETKTVVFSPTDEDIKFWDETSRSWNVAAGTYTVSIGNSSRYLPVAYTFEKPYGKLK